MRRLVQTIIKYWVTAGTVKQQAIGETSTCSLVSDELTAMLCVLEHARKILRKTAYVYVATTSREALSAIEKAHKVICGRKNVHKPADAVLEMESVDHRVTIFLVPGDKGIHGVAEAKKKRLQEQSSTMAASSQPPQPRGCASCREYYAWPRRSRPRVCIRTRMMPA
jgi:hypothetical protein